MKQAQRLQIEDLSQQQKANCNLAGQEVRQRKRRSARDTDESTFKKLAMKTSIDWIYLAAQEVETSRRIDGASTRDTNPGGLLPIMGLETRSFDTQSGPILSNVGFPMKYLATATHSKLR